LQDISGQSKAQARLLAKMKRSGDLAAGFPREYWFFFEGSFGNRLALSKRAQPVLEGFHVSIENGRDVKSEQLRKNQSSDPGQAERTPRFRSRIKSQRDGQRAHERSHGGHHDGTETQQRTLIDGFLRRFAAVALFFQRHVDHHDGIFLDDAHQHDDAHKRVEIQI